MMTINRKIALLTILPISLTIVFAALLVRSEWGEVATAEIMFRNAKLVKHASNLLTQLHKERGQSDLFSNGTMSLAELAAQRKQTDLTQEHFLMALDEARIAAAEKMVRRKSLSQLPRFREDMDRKLPRGESLKNYDKIITDIIGVQTLAIRGKTTKGLGKRFVNISLFEDAKKNMGDLQVLISGILAANKPLTQEQFGLLISCRSRVSTSLESPVLSVSSEAERQITALQKTQAWRGVSDVFDKIIKNADKGEFGADPKAFFNNAALLIDGIDALGKRESEDVEREAMSIRESSQAGIRWMGIILALAILATGAFSFAIGRSISRPIAAVAKDIEEASQQVAAAAGDISASSQSLANGTSEQASSLQETSASLEEMSSMTKQSADNAGKAKTMMMEVSRIVAKVDRHMGEMAAAVAEITRSSEETGKIIKTIDEIAFQTNLLALNAAVEAARAGEAGAGFAVVADEVRNLAMRASEAAKNTNILIENTIKAVRKGNELTTSTREAFKANAAISKEIGQVVSEIATASAEQSQGIGQVNIAVSEMDKAVQSAAANAEESAAAAEELNAQAEQMKVFVQDLIQVVGGRGNGQSA